MPKPTEVAEIRVGGRKFRDWTSVQVDLDYATLTRLAQFTTIEHVTKTGGRPQTTMTGAMQIKPGDKVEVYLAGNLAMRGVVIKRQAAYDSRSHGVQIFARSKVGDLYESSAPLKATAFRKVTLEQAAKKLIEPFGFELKVENPSKIFSKAFKELNVNPGESVWALIDRLARMRQMFLHDDEEGRLVIASMDPGASVIAELQEGRNILAASCLIQDDAAFGRVEAIQQQRGDDQTDGDTARKPAGAVDSGNSDRHRPLTVIAEQPGDKEEMAARAQHEWNKRIGEIINAQISVQGWLKDNGSLWNYGEMVKVYSPMLMLKHDLAVQSVSFRQDNTQTTTTLFLVRKEKLQSAAPPMDGRAGDGGVLPGKPQEAKPVDEEET